MTGRTDRAGAIVAVAVAMLAAVATAGCTGAQTAGGMAAGAPPGSSERTPARATMTPRATERVSIDVGGVVLHGTLEVPAGQQPHMVALIIAGSGATDRDGNTLGQEGARNTQLMMAQSLADAGIASLRYDKRGVGESLVPGMREEDLTFDVAADDAAAWIEWLRAERRFAGVAIVGHSEGGLVGTLAAQQAEVDALVLLAAMGRTFGDVLREQLGRQLPPLWMQQADSLFAEMEAGRRVEAPATWPPALQALVRPSVQPYMISLIAIDPAAELAKLDVPTLIMHGTTDLQTTLDDAQRLAAARPDARLAVIEGMNHVLKMVEGTMIEQLPSYSDPTLPLAPELERELIRFLLEIGGGRG